jgi:hypothetical protein
MIYDWTHDNTPRGKHVHVTIDGRGVTHVTQCDTDAGWLERYVTDDAGEVRVVTIDGQAELAREKLFGVVKVEVAA